MVNKDVDATWHKAVESDKLMLSKGCYPMDDACKGSDRVNGPIFTGIMAFVMGIITMIRVSRNMPKKLTDATLYSSSVNCDDTMYKGQVHHHQLPAPAVSVAEYMTVMKRMAELEEKVNILSTKPAAMPADKEEMLNAAVSRIDALEQELMATKKALEDSVARQEELLTYIEKKKKKKNKLNPFRW